MRPALPAALALAAALAGPAAAQTSDTADAPMATSGGSADVSRQIQQYLDASPAACAGPESLEPLPDRRPHGEVSVAVGSHGYRSAYVRSDIPVGETGTVSVAVGESRGGRWGYWGHGGRQQHLALGFDFSRPRPERRIGADWAADERAAGPCPAERWLAGPATQP